MPKTERRAQIVLPESDEEKEVLRPSGWKLDAMRTDITPEICSPAGLADIARFIGWLVIGYFVTWGLNALNGWMDNLFCAYSIFHCGALLDFIQEVCMYLSLGGIMGAFYIRSWWLLSFFVGGAVRLIQRDLIAQRTWENCETLNVHGPYIWNQKFVQFSGPVAALWFVMTSQALDRMYNDKRRDKSQEQSQDEKACAKTLVFGPVDDVYNPFCEGAGGHQGLVMFKLICGSDPEDTEEIPLYTYEDLAVDKEDLLRMKTPATSNADCACADTLRICCRAFAAGWEKFLQRGDDDSSESDEETPQQSDEEIPLPGQLRVGQFAKELDDKDAILIYNAEGHFQKCQILQMERQKPERQELSNQILEACCCHSKMPKFLFVPGESWTKKQSCLWSTEPPKKPQRRFWFFFLIAFPGMFCYACFKFGYGPRVSVLLLVLPDLVEAFVSDLNQTDITPTHFNDTIKHGEKAIKNVISSTWSCVHGKDLIRTQAALFTSTFFFLACQVILIIACYHLHEASRSLHELNDLLMVLLYRKDDHEYQAVLLHKLHQIRQRITTEGCLDHFADHAFPHTLGPDKSLIWWFQNRAAIFADIKFNMEKRIVVLLLCLFLSIALGMLAILVSHFNLQEDGFGIICYAFAHGVASALILILYFFFGSRVNAELRSGIETLERLYKTNEENEENETDTESQSPRRQKGGRPQTPKGGRSLTPRRKGMRPQTPTGGRSLTPRGGPPLFDPEDAENIQHLLEHSKHRPYTLKFLCFNLTTGFFSLVATPLATFAGSLIWLVLKRYGFDVLEGAT